MRLPDAALVSVVPALAPTGRPPPPATRAGVWAALLERPRRCRSDRARALPRAHPPVHGRRKRLRRLLDHRRVDAAALGARWLKPSDRVGAAVPGQPAGRSRRPVWRETTGCAPVAALPAAVPRGRRGLLAAVPQRGPPRPVPGGLRRCAARGRLRSVRRGRAVRRAPDRTARVLRLVHRRAGERWPPTPHGRRRPLRDRRRQGWLLPA